MASKGPKISKQGLCRQEKTWNINSAFETSNN